MEQRPDHCHGLILVAVVFTPITDQPAEAQNNNDRHAATACPHCSASPFPVTDEPEVARVYATARPTMMLFSS